MNVLDSQTPPSPPPRRTAFLLSQLGAFTADRFAREVRELGLSASDAGVLRLLARSPGLSQRALADRLGSVPSRVVVLVDSLESRGLVLRTRSASDRRNHELTLTEAGIEMLSRLRTVGERHEAEVLGALTDEERAELNGLLTKLSAAHGLDADVHPGYARG